MAFLCFSIGLVSVIAAAIVGYLSHARAREGKEASARAWEKAGIGFTISSLISFVVGAGMAIGGVLPFSSA